MPTVSGRKCVSLTPNLDSFFIIPLFSFNKEWFLFTHIRAVMLEPAQHPNPNAWAGGGQADNVLAIGHESRGFEPSHRRPASLFAGLLLAAVLFLKSAVHCYFVNKGRFLIWYVQWEYDFQCYLVQRVTWLHNVCTVVLFSWTAAV